MRLLLVLLCGIALMSSCSINNSTILKTHRDFKFDTVPALKYSEVYRITPNDVLTFKLYANEGFKMIDMANNTQDRTQANKTITSSYVVEQDSMANLPIIGRVKLAGKTLKEAELMLEERFSVFYNRPFVILNVSNRRVIVFKGSADKARVVQLRNNNTSLLEVLAEAGGLDSRGKAKSIRLIRMIDGDRKVYNIDLSTIDNMKYIDITVQASDVIYVEPVPDIAREVFREFSPVFNLVTTSITLWLILTRGF